MHSLIFVSLGFVIFSVISAFPTLHQSSNDDDFSDLFSSSSRVEIDGISLNSLNNLNDPLENLFSNSAYADPSDDDLLLSSDPNAAKWDGLSSSNLISPEPELQSNLFEDNLGPIASSSSSSDTPSLYQSPINQDTSYDPLSSSSSLLDGNTLISPGLGAIAQAPVGAPSCSSLKARKSNIAFQSLCCETPCIDVQSWRKDCRHCM